MKIITKGKNMNNFKKIGLTALAGSLATFSVNAAEMAVNGATMLTYTSEDSSEVTGNPIGMKTNIAFTASGDVNGYTVSYMNTMNDAMTGQSSNRLSVDMGDIGTISYDNASGSGLATIDDKTPSAAEEIWDGLGATGATVGGLVGYGSTGVINYVNSFAGYNLNASFRKGSAASQGDGASSGAGEGSYMDAAITGSGDDFGVDGLAWGVAFNVNENLAISYGEAETEYAKAGATHVTEKLEGIAVSYTMGSMKIAGNRNEGNNIAGTAGVGGQDSMTEIAVSFAF